MVEGMGAPLWRPGHNFASAAWKTVSGGRSPKQGGCTAEGEVAQVREWQGRQGRETVRTEVGLFQGPVRAGSVEP